MTLSQGAHLDLNGLHLWNKSSNDGVIAHAHFFVCDDNYVLLMEGINSRLCWPRDKRNLIRTNQMLRIPNHGVVHGIGTPPWTSGSRVIGLVLYASLGTEVGLVCLFIMQQ